MGDGVANDSLVDFGAFTALHFARFVLVGSTQDLRADTLPAWLVYMADLDLAKDRHLAELVDAFPEAVDRLFGHCVDYPDVATRPSRLGYLRGQLIAQQ